MLESMYAPKRQQGADSPLKAYLAKAQNPVSDVLNSAQVASRQQQGAPGAAAPSIGQNGNPTGSPADILGSFANFNALTGPPLPGSGGYGAKADTPETPVPKFSFDTDYSADPVLQKMLAGGAADEADADAAALGARRGVVQQLGDRNLASSVLGANDPTLGSISDDPNVSTSTLARLKRAYGDTVKTNEDSLNADNLWYGGHHGKVLGDLSKDYQTQIGDVSAQAQAALDQIAGQLSSTKKGIRDQRVSAESAAADRKAQQLLAEILAGSAGGTTPTNTTPPPTNDTPPPPDGGSGSADTGSAGQYWDPVKQMWVQRVTQNQGYTDQL